MALYHKRNHTEYILHRKFHSIRGGVEWQIQNKAKSSAVFATRPHPRAKFYHTARVYGAFTDLRGRNNYDDNY